MKLALGTVQFGMSYGAFNRTGAVPESDVAKCLELAANRSVDTIDTARAYGESESVLGRLEVGKRFRVVTKVAPLNGGSAPEAMKSFRTSLAALKADRIYALLLHRSADLTGPEGAQVWNALEDAKARGLVQRVGVSVYAPEEIEALLGNYPIEIVQAPFSAFDQRFRTSGVFDRLAGQGVEVHVRSVFLQGFALADPDALPSHLSGYRSLLVAFQRRAREVGATPLELALHAAADEPAISRVVVGVQSLANLREVLAASSKTLPFCDVQAFANEDQALINPSSWARTA